MKVSLEWLREFVPEAPDAQKIADALTLGGLPCENIERVGTDDVLDVEVTSNRSDCLSIMGVAREVAALMNLNFVAPKWETEPSGVAASAAMSPISVTIEANTLCPHYTARLIRGIKVGQSPAWMVRRLEAVGVRAINNIVDITNYVLFETGQPLHAFDLTKLGGGKIIVRAAREGETLLTLDGKEQKLATSMLVIADATRPVALAGVMGGELSGVTNATTDLLLESARFDPLSVRKTARTLQMASDSSYRFERGLDPTLAKRASERACGLITQLAGGKVDGPFIEAGTEGYTPTLVTLRLSAIKRLLGVEWPIDRVAAALDRLGFSPKTSGESVSVLVPSTRLDVKMETDLIEEVARVIGYHEIPTRDSVSVRLTQREPARVAADVIRTQLNAAGYFEALTFSFVSDKLAESFKHDEAATLHRVESATRKADAQLRPSILPNLLESIVLNENNGTNEARLFETASVFWIDANAKSVERRALGIVGSDDYLELRGTVEAVLSRLDKSRSIRIAPAKRKGFGPNACGEVFWNGASVGYVGKVDRAVADKLSLNGLPAIAELWLEPLLAGYQPVPQLTPLPKYPAIRRDLSLLVTDAVRYEQIESLVGELKLDALEGVDYVTTYRGKPLEKGSKSVTFTLSFRKPDGTLTSGEVDERVGRVVELAKTKLSATLRA
jgi:phenylalanyl-tRNA synthetase beta chain